MKRLGVARGQQIATHVCASCHAVYANSGIATYPRLAGQNPRYIATNAKEMRDQVGVIFDQDFWDVAVCFSKQYPKAGEVQPKSNPEWGAKIFRGGIVKRKVAACMPCHDPNGAGTE